MQNSKLDHKEMMQIINDLAEKYQFLSVNYIGESILGRSIPMLTIGSGKKALLYVGAQYATDCKTSLILLNFVSELCRSIDDNIPVFGINTDFMTKIRSISIIPMLNPDGVDYNINGIHEDNPLYERVLAMNNGSRDLSRWTSNARGVDINKNYLRSVVTKEKNELEATNKRAGEWEESEPEVGALCNYLRYNVNIIFTLSLYMTQEKVSFYLYEFNDNKNSIVNTLSKDYWNKPVNNYFSGLSTWCSEQINIPSLSLFLSDQEMTKNVLDFKLKKLLFRLPTLI